MIQSEIEIFLKPILDESKLELVELNIKGTRRSPVFQIFIDHEQGVTISDCTRLSREIGMVLDREYPELANYRLEVSSPGTDRPLKTERDFSRNIGRVVRLAYEENDVIDITGTIESVETNSVRLEVDGEVQSIPIASIKSAKIQLKW